MNPTILVETIIECIWEPHGHIACDAV